MYFAMIRFDILYSTYFSIEEKVSEIFTFQNIKFILKALDAQNISDGSELLLIVGAFDTENEAKDTGNRCVQIIKYLCFCKSINIKISGGNQLYDTIDVVTDMGGFTTSGRKAFDIPDNVLNSFYGLKIIEAMSWDEVLSLVFVGSKCNMSAKIRMSFDFSDTYFFDKKSKIALSLLTASVSSIYDIRISFLLKIMAIECLVSDDQCVSAEILYEIDAAINNTTNQDFKVILEQDKKLSISKKTKNIILQYLKDDYNIKLDSESGKVYTAKKFWDKCYGIRSKFVHCGLSDESLNEINQKLHAFVCDFFEKYLRENQRVKEDNNE